MITLITGAGVIGCHTARLLAARGEDVLLMDVRPAREAIATIAQSPRLRIVEGDVTDFAMLSDLIAGQGIRRVVHTAALLSTAIREDPRKGIEVNVMGVANVLEAARQQALERVVLASSTTVGYPSFGDFEGPTFPEDFALKSISHRPGSIYAATKVTAEHLALLYRDLYGVSTVSLRYAAVISAWNGPGTSVPGRVLSSLAGPASSGQVSVIDDPYVVWRGGEEFIDARDCALANVAALDAADPAQGAYNIGLGHLCTFHDFEQAVRRLHPSLQVELRIEPTGGFAGFPHVRHAASDIGAAARELGWRPAFSLTDSVAHFAPLCLASTPHG
ncbi:NAD-dependent epimerase/dehydratase family protein [Variovorax saccharolyticus]|uniref:NAD-dependent epimerase/dehydratase family protein n=1 Tax=Variovorax saccharolyticus TaxID=3053516 RepID=UPI0025786FBF|nr:NAD(P)-dependent oxidoreductase [Variovorax sp. J31P216]MDM0024352.1 NAD(P)-dependent oxidoreductase [Variovorax sp. J31P216]